jgi:FMN phosphatase YigB (HAD superfamily)
MITTCLFDYGQTLVNSAEGFRSAEKTAQTRIFESLQVESWSAFLNTYRNLRKEFHSRSVISRKALWTQVYAHFDDDPDPNFLLDLERAYWERVKSKTFPFPEAQRVLHQLSLRFQLGLITNTQGQEPPDHHRISQFPELAEFFKMIVVAGEAGIPPKPNPEPFLICLTQLDANPEDAIFVGDDWLIDIKGAEGVGIQPVWLKHHSVSRNWPKVESPVPVITDLEQLLSHVLLI